ncbi:MAG: CoA:oxalate CoA-transferase [Candidatus Azotimanducaceae bacterium]|jgi:CoA:oxalate CoA-transferase
MKHQPLSGITVLDFGQVYNGPYCGFLLAQAGARVIKIESLIGETLRARGGKTSSSYPFSNLNANKDCMTLNLKSARGQSIVKQLVPSVDVVLQNFAPGTLEKFGLGDEDLRAINPALIYAKGTGYGSLGGPYMDYLGMDITLQAMSGAMAVTGEEGGPPLKTPAAYTDFLAGVHLYSGIVTALFARTQSGEGATVDISMQDCVFPTLSTAIGAYYSEGIELPRAGSRHPSKALAPYNVYEAKDGHVAIICIREGHWRKVCDAMGRAELKDDERFADVKSRSTNIDLVDDIVNNWTRTLSREEIFRVAQDHGVISAPVQTIKESVNDVHMHARGSLTRRQHPDIGEISQFQTPIRFKDIDPPDLNDVHGLSEDTDRVLQEFLNLDEATIAQLRNDGVIA